MFRRNCVLMVAVVAAAWINTAKADLMTGHDPSFETYPLADGGFGNLGAVFGTQWLGSGYYENPNNSMFPNTTYVSPSSPGSLPSPADGLQAAKMINAQETYQQIGTVQAGMLYTLQVAVGASYYSVDTKDGYGLGNWNIALGSAAGASDFASVTYSTGNNPVAVGFVDNSCSFVASSSDANKPLYITLSGGGGTVTTITYFDNVRLDASPVPEPGTLALLATGLLGLLCYAWRRRR